MTDLKMELIEDLVNQAEATIHELFSMMLDKIQTVKEGSADEANTFGSDLSEWEAAVMEIMAEVRLMIAKFLVDSK